MSRLIYKGNIIQNFGEFLPTPYIDKIVVNDDWIDLYAGLYIYVDEDEDVDEIIETLKIDELTFYYVVTVSPGTQTVDAVKNHEVDAFNLIYTAKYMKEIGTSEAHWRRPWWGPDLVWYSAGSETAVALMDTTGTDNYWAARRAAYYPLLTPDAPAIMGTWFASSFEPAEIIYTADGKKIIKLAITLEEEITGGLFTNTYFMGDYGISAFGSARLENWANMTLYAFCSRIDIDDSGDSWDEAIETYLENPKLLDLNTSAIAYERIISNNVLESQTEVIYVDKNRHPYDQTPLQSITSQYYKADNYTHANIVKYFQDLIDEYDETKRSNHPHLDNALNNISYVLGVYPESAELLPQLNLLRKTFTSTSTATAVGRLYVRFRRRIYNSNLTVVKQDKLFKQLVVNPKIIDNRTITTTDWEPYNGDSSFSFIYADEGSNSGEALYSNWYTSIEEVYDNESEYNLISSGFFFFDYEKVALSSSISAIFDVRKLETYFGQELINATIDFGDYGLYRSAGGLLEEEEITDFGNFAAHIAATALLAGNGWGEPDDMYYIYDTTANAAPSWGTYNSFVVPRSFNLPSASLNDYRLACFQFQDVFTPENEALTTELYAGAAHADEDGEEISSGENIIWDDDTGIPSANWKYVATLSINDWSVAIAPYLMAKYYDEMVNFETYAEYAAEACNYNSIGGTFNDFFIEGMNNTYGDNLASAPWVVMPLIYCIHLDLINNTFNGDSDKTFETARALSMKISPYTGILGQVQSFYESVKALFDEQYTDYGDIGSTTWTADTGTDFGGTTTIAWTANEIMQSSTLYPDGIEYSNQYTVEFSDLPAIAQYVYDITSLEDVKEFEDIVAYFVISDWNSSQIEYDVDDADEDGLYGSSTIDGWGWLTTLESATANGSDGPGASDDHDGDWYLIYGSSFETWIAYVEYGLEGFQDYIDGGIRTESEIITMVGLLTDISSDTTWAEYYNGVASETNSFNMGAHNSNYLNYVKTLMVTIFPTMKLYSDLDPTSPISYVGYDEWL